MFKDRETWHEVQDDEDLPIIAAQYGIKEWQLIYDHRENGELRQKRPNPHVLYQGDRLWIPKVEPKEFDADTNKTHKFVLYPPKTVLQLFLRDDDGNAYGNVKYELWINGARFGEAEKKTREDGLIFEMIPVVKEVELRVWFPVLKEEEDETIEEGEPEPRDEGDDHSWDDEIPIPEEEFVVDPDVYQTFIVKLAHLDPVSTIEGIQDRLNNLGYSCGDEHGEIGPNTQQALREFQSDYGLPATGQVDLSEGVEDATVKKLAEVYEGGENGAETGNG